MNHLRRIISLLLVLVLCFGLIPGVSAAEVDTPGADIPTEVTEETAPPTTEDTTPTEEPRTYPKCFLRREARAARASWDSWVLRKSDSAFPMAASMDAVSISSS